MTRPRQSVGARPKLVERRALAVMVQKIHLEYPKGDVVDSPLAHITGWCTTADAATALTIRIDEQVVAHTVVDRADVRRVFPGVPSFGFTYAITPELCVGSRDRELVVRFELGDTTLERTLRLTDAAIDEALSWQRIKAAKREWCLSVLRCPTCREGRPALDDAGALVCPTCHAALEQTTSALNALPGELYRRAQLKPTAKVSSHPYVPAVAALVDEVRSAGGRTLDCGAGRREVQDESIVNMEIVDYASTDVLAVGQALPFADASFDLVLSLAVLEHVDDPFACAAELVRVVKPGGKIFCVVPFLQPEHGYPNHFFNMTRQGLAKLFDGKARILAHEVPTYGAPIYTLCWFVHEYLANLPPDARASFERLTIKDIASLKKTDYWQQPYVRALSTEGNWRLASVTAALLVRDEPTSGER